MSTNSIPAIPAKSSMCSAVRIWLNPVWCAPPAWIQAAAAIFKFGCGTHTTRATGSLGSGASGVNHIDLVDDHAEAVAHIDHGSIERRADLDIEDQAGRVSFAADGQRVDLKCGLAVGDGGAHFEHVRAEHFHSLRGEVVGVIFHEGGSARQANAHHFHRPHQRRGFPVAFRAKTVAICHQALHSQSGQLLQPVQIFKGGGEGFEAARSRKERMPSSILAASSSA